MKDAQQPKDEEDSLEVAHLAYLRGDMVLARAILDTVLAAEPGNADARKLRDLAESVSVEVCATELRNEGWLARIQPSAIQFLGIMSAGIGLIVLAVYLALDPIHHILKHGL